MVLAVLAPLVLVIALATAVYVQVRFHDARRRRPRADRRGALGVRGQAPTVDLDLGDDHGGLRRAAAVATSDPCARSGFWCVVATLEMLLTIFLVYPALLAIFPGRAPGRQCRPGGIVSAPRARARRPGRIRHRAAVIGSDRGGGSARRSLGLPASARRGQRARRTCRAIIRFGGAIERLEAGRRRQLGGRARARAWSSAAAARTSPPARGSRTSPSCRALLRDESGAIGVVGLGDVVDAALRRGEHRAERRGFGGGAACELRRLQRMTDDPRGREAVQRFLSTDGSSTRLTLFVRTVGLDALTPVLDRGGRRSRASSFPRRGSRRPASFRCCSTCSAD